MPLNNLWLAIVYLIATGGFFLSLWIVIPAPTYFLLPLGVGAPEISPLLLILNAIALGLNIVTLKQFSPTWLSTISLVSSLSGIIFSLLPWLQLAATNQRFQAEITAVLGKDYLAKIPQTLRAKMRSQPFIWFDLIRGIQQPQIRIKRKIIFAQPENISLKLNLYQPLKPGKYPTIIVIYGGAWRKGSPDDDEQLSCYLANQGYCVIAIDYRHAPEFQFPCQLEDVNQALNYIYDRALELECDRDKIAILGRSAGGHLALLAAYQQTQNKIPFKAVISYYGPINLTEAYHNPPVPDPINTRAVLHDFLGASPQKSPNLYQQASPINYVQTNLPPTLLIYPRRDHLVAAKYGKNLAENSIAQGNMVIYLEIPWAEHAFDKIFSGISNQLVLFYLERYLAIILFSES